MIVRQGAVCAMTGFIQSKDPLQHEKLTPWLMGKEDIPAFLDLQERARQALTDEQKHFLKPRTAEDLKIHLDAGMPMIGLKDDKGHLCAQALIGYPYREDAVSNLDGYPGMTKAGTVAIVQSLSVDPDIKGKGLAGKLLDVAGNLAAQHGHVALMAKVAQENTCSKQSFLKAGFEIASTGMDPRAGYPVLYLQQDFYACGAAPRSMALTAKVA